MNEASANNRIYNVPVPNFDPDFEHPAPDCQRPELRELFFAPEYGAKPNRSEQMDKRRREREARLICGSCPFVVECGMHGLRHEDYGIWGGLNEHDRRDLGGRGVGGRGPRPRRSSLVKRLHRGGLAGEVIVRLLTRWDDEQREVA